jgi:hypothetical protein
VAAVLALAYRPVQAATPGSLRRLWPRYAVAALPLVAVVVMWSCDTGSDAVTRRRQRDAAQAGHQLPSGLRVVHLATASAALDVVPLEAEAAITIDPPMRIVAHNDASGHLALEVPPDVGKEPFTARYRATVPRAGAYRLQARVLWRDGCSNSLAFQIGEDRIELNSGVYEQWHVLVAPRTVMLTAGELDLAVVTVEDGVMLDYLELAPAAP